MYLHSSTYPTVISSEGWIVQAPVIKIIVGSIYIPIKVVPISIFSVHIPLG